jgi:hypothetical protein
MDLAFDIDYAIGAQLDTLGVIIGLSRNVKIAIPNVFFSWYDGTAATEHLGWGEGSWRDPREHSATEMTILPDDAYRQLLKFKIIQNCWKGTIPELYTAWNNIFASDGLTLSIVDNQNMTAEITVSGAIIPAAVQYILLGNYIPLKPAGVYISFIFEVSSP